MIVSWDRMRGKPVFAALLLYACDSFCLFHCKVDGRTNSKIQSVFLEKFPVYKARFSADGEQVVATSSHNKLFYVYDMIEGRIVPVQGVRGEQGCPCGFVGFLILVIYCLEILLYHSISTSSHYLWLCAS